jgi:integrase
MKNQRKQRETGGFQLKSPGILNTPRTFTACSRDSPPFCPGLHNQLQQSDLARAGESANRAAADYLFADYRQRRVKKTLRTQTAALLLWVQYLAEVGAASGILREARVWALSYFDPDTLAGLAEYAQSQQTPLPIIYAAHYCQHQPAAWQGVTWGLVEGFVKWLLNQGYSLASVNNRLSAVKVYARLAAKAGVIPPTEHALIGEVRGYGRTEGKRVDEVRSKVRVGNKKKEAIVLTAVQARQLKTQHPPTPQGVRDRLLIGLLLDLGLRVSEAAALTVEDLAEPGYLTVYRQKTDTTDRMELTADLLAAPGRLPAVHAWQRHFAARQADQPGDVGAGHWRPGEDSGRDILGLWDLSPHDLRPTWATSGLRGRRKKVILLCCTMPAAGPICRRPAATWKRHRCQ